MSYTEIEQFTLDLDLFFKDSQKNIHLASGGGKIPDLLANSDEINENFKDTAILLDEDFEIEVNQELMKVLNLKETEFQNYLFDFVKYAKKGFFSYDKTKLGEFDDMTFHLVAKPKNNKSQRKKGFNLLKINNSLPETFTTFILSDYIK